MGSNKIACAHITCEEIRIIEGRVNDGVMLVTKTAVVPKARRFFHGKRLAFLAEMVSCITDTMKVNSFTAKTLHLVYDNEIYVDFFVDEKLAGQKNAQQKGLNLSLGKKDKDKQNKQDTGTITHKKAWGKYITEDEMGELYTTVTIERDLVEFMITEFQERGYKIASLEVPETALMYLRKFVPFSYDALNKLVVHADNKNDGHFYHFTKDAPAGPTPLHFDDIVSDNFADKVIGVIKEEIQKKRLVNPHVMLVGDAFADPNEYIECCKRLKDEGLYSIDMYSLWKDRSAPINSVRVITQGANEEEIELNGKFGICIALLARALESKPENLIEGFHPMFMGKRTKKILVEAVSVCAIAFLLYNAIGFGFGTYEVYVANQEFTKASRATEATLDLAEQQRDIVKTQVANLSTIDSRYNEIFKFVYEQVNEDLNIASVDTQDLIPADEEPQSVYDENGEPVEDTPVDVTGASNTNNYTMQTIVIRGYSRTTSGPVSLYNALVGAGMGEVKIVGIEQVMLPSGEALFTFELTVGTNGEGGM